MRIVNFGRNLSYEPQVLLVPHTENEVLDLLRQYSGRSIRVIGRLHSWSQLPVSTEVILDLRNLDTVHVEQRDSRIWATIGGGCQISHALLELKSQAKVTL